MSVIVMLQPFMDFSDVPRTSSISLRMYGVTESTSSKHFFFWGGYKAYCIKNIQFYAVQSIYCIKNLFPHHPNIHKHIQISFIARLGILHQ